ncbi:hypothetical protein GPALN_012451 [Globodera pallida]|nr:hypothetical protein GPALN_012451 [Globodera pallida]
MNFLAKHFFDYQSYINLPHHALQMHKTPPSQAGTDPAAAWAPKDLHVAGKNQAAPAARANRTYHGDQRTGSHRHGRPSKLEFRAWGERHGELRAEKIVPHQEHLLHGHVDIGGGLAQRRHTASGGVDNFPSEYFPARQLLQRHRANTAQQQQQMKRVQLLVILTMAPHLDFVTVTVKSTNPRDGAGADEAATADGIQVGASFLLRVPPSAPLRLPFCHIVLSLYAVSFDGAEEEPQPQQLLGSCQLGPSGSASSGHSQWRQMIKKLGVPIAAWHELVGRPAAAAAAVDDGCGGGGGGDLPPSQADDYRNNTVPRRRTTVSVPPLTVEMMRTLVAARQQSPPRICMETKKHAASTAAASSSRQQIGIEMGTKNEC